MLDSLMFTLFAAIVIIVIILELTTVSQMRARRSKQKPEKVDLGVAERETSEWECHYFLGYLATHPKNQPVPNQCFGCEKAAECINSNLTESSNTKIPDVIETEPR